MTEVVKDPKSKADVVTVLLGVRTAILYAFVLQELVDRSGVDIAASVDGKKFSFQHKDEPQELVDLSYLAGQLRDPTARGVIRENLAIILRHNLVRLAHEIVFEYARASGQEVTYNKAPFYEYVRVLRNVVSHADGSRLTRWPDGLKKQGIHSVTWRGRTISSTDVGRDVFLDPAQAIQLHDDMAAFAEKDLL